MWCRVYTCRKMCKDVRHVALLKIISVEPVFQMLKHRPQQALQSKDLSSILSTSVKEERENLLNKGVL